MTPTPIRLALSGSGTRVSAHVGALEALISHGFNPVEIAGTSGGSIIAACYASGMPLASIRDLAYTINFQTMMGLSPLAVPFHAVSTGKALLKFLLDQTKSLTFAQAPVSCVIVASDVLTGREFVFSRATTPDVELGFAARASASIPFFFEPVTFDDHLLVDGGCCDNIPSDHLIHDTIQRVAVSLTADDSPLAPGWHPLMTFAGRVVDMLLASNQDYRLAAGGADGVVVVQVPTGNASSMDRNMALSLRQSLYMAGYNAVAKSPLVTGADLAAG